jgi:hypothetical protein
MYCFLNGQTFLWNVCPFDLGAISSIIPLFLHQKAIMYKLMFCLILIQITSNLNGQHNTYPQFPKDWFGKWEGNLEVFRHQKVVQNVPMRFECLPTDSIDIYTWCITYGTDTLTGRRSYTLKAKDKTTGYYVIDENNGILIDGFVLAHKFFNRFEVMDNQLTATYERSDDLLIFEIMVNTINVLSSTGDTISTLGEKIPAVKSYTINGYQRAVLTRVK